ncbi:MAG: N-acetyltransferase [Bacteroidetes bacterium B1(2017)]|nr:MAG: N-acetyltransferase [Bacteroidetes bacterium B1(2017)]
METKPIQIIETERLKLKVVDANIYEHVLKNYTDAEIAQFFGHQNEIEIETEKNRLKNGIQTHSKTILLFYLEEKISAKVFAWCGYHTWYFNHNRAELGYSHFGDDFKQKGYMKEALPFIIKYGFEQMKLHRIEAMISPLNTPSLKLIHQNNFKYEGLMREHYLKNEVYEDSAVYSLLKSEWDGLN